jgi:hypothetical protein
MPIEDIKQVATGIMATLGNNLLVNFRSKLLYFKIIC